jgi:hypothetical protein
MVNNSKFLLSHSNQTHPEFIAGAHLIRGEAETSSA